MVLHTRILECLHSLGIHNTLIEFLEKTMKDWRVELTCVNKSLGEVKIKRGIVQGYTPSPLLFIITLIPLKFILKKTKPAYTWAAELGRLGGARFPTFL